MVNSKQKELSILERMYSTGADNNPSNLSKGLNTTKNKKADTRKAIYKNTFEVRDFIKEKTFTNMLLPAIFDAIGNNIIKIGIAVSTILLSIGYLIQKIRG